MAMPACALVVVSPALRAAHELFATLNFSAQFRYGGEIATF
jgi:hypothetical protein